DWLRQAVKSNYDIRDDRPRPNNHFVHQDVFNEGTAMIDHAFGPEETTWLNFGVTVDDSFAANDGWSAGYRLRTNDRTYSNVNRPDYAGAVFDRSLDVLRRKIREQLMQASK